MHGTIWNGLRFALTILSGNILYSFAFVAACGPLQTHFHREGSYRKAAATTVDIPSRWDLQQRRPLPAAETGRSCWGSGQQDARPLQGPLQTLSAATRDIKKEPTGLFFAACRRPCSFDSSYGLHDPATPVDIPTGWDPRTKQQSTGLLFATYRWPCCSIPVRVAGCSNPGRRSYWLGPEH